MNSQFLPKLTLSDLLKMQEEQNLDGIYDVLVQPIHEELYKRQDFSFVEQLSPGQELLLKYDYLRMQVLQGGFIQMIQNGYVTLLLNMPAMFDQIGQAEMAKLLDDVLKVYSLNAASLSRETSVEEFAQLYQEFTEFEELDQRFAGLHPIALESIVNYALRFPDEFIQM